MAVLDFPVNPADGAVYQLWTWSSATGTWNLTPQQAVPPGVIHQYGGTTAPTGYLLCDGTEKSIATYGNLYAVLGTLYGSLTNGSGGAGTTHFRLPDMAGRVPTGKNTGGTFATLNNKGGGESRILTSAQIPAHTHPGTTNPDGYHAHTVYGVSASYAGGSGTLSLQGDSNLVWYRGNGSVWSTGGGQGGSRGGMDISAWSSHTSSYTPTHTHSFTTGNNTGGGNSFDILQPYIVLNYIIKI